ncbi:MAG: hypothetical protein R2753_18260 [Chitinophagales bacterium]
MSFRGPKSVFDNRSFQYVVDVLFQLYSFREYIKLTERTINIEIKNELSRYNKFLNESSDFEIEHMYDFEDHTIKTLTHQLYYNSIFISIYSFLEKKMFQLCKLAEVNETIKIKDLSGEGIFKYYKYLKKVLLLDLDNLNEDWTRITKYNKLRNRLVHLTTNTIDKSENNSKLIKTIASIKNLNVIDKGDYYEFEISSTKILLDFLEVIENFLDKIYFERKVF